MLDDWWTEADQAELNVLIHALVDVAFIHREWCPDCPCQPFREAIEAVLDWRYGRILKSKAAWLRAREDAA